MTQTVLIVEDEKKVATFIQAALEQEGYAVDTLPDGDAAGGVTAMRWLRLLVTGLALISAPLIGAQSALAVQPDEILSDPVLEGRARVLSKELRCMVCQNQSIDDSDAPLARDLRLLVRERIAAGDSNSQVLDFLVARYGEFVLLKPRFEKQTMLLWLLAPVLLIGGGLAASMMTAPARLARSRRMPTGTFAGRCGCGRRLRQPSTGRPRTRTVLPALPAGSPLVVDDRLYLPTVEHTIVVVHTGTGEPVGTIVLAQDTQPVGKPAEDCPMVAGDGWLAVRRGAELSLLTIHSG